MNEEQLKSFLKDEYLFLQNTYEDFDRRSLIIKGWSVTVALTGIGLALQAQSIPLLLLAGLAALLFWVMEALWKFFQYCSGPRITEIESFFRGEKKKSSRCRSIQVGLKPSLLPAHGRRKYCPICF